MTESEFRNELKCLSGGYLFLGDEDYLKYSYSKEVQNNVLDGQFDEFNHIVIYAEEFSSYQLENAISTLPMMSERKLVEVRGVNFNTMKKDELDELEGVLSILKDSEHTVLIVRADNDYFNAGRLPKSPSELYKMMTKYLTPVFFDFPSPSRLKSWILRHFSKENVEFDPELSSKLIDFCGHDMWAISNEISKLCAYAKMENKSKITDNDIEYICCKTIEYDDFQLTNALLEKNKHLVFETLYRQKVSHEPPYAILSSLVRLFSELLIVSKLSSLGQAKAQIASQASIHEFKVGRYLQFLRGENPKKLERALEICRESDVKSKSMSNVGAYIGAERLISSLVTLFCR